MTGKSAFAVRRMPDVVEMTVTGPWSSEARALVEAGDVDRLVLNRALGFTEPDLGLLAGLPLRQLVILARDVTDLAPVHTLGPTLELLHLTASPDARVDLRELTRVSDLAADWPQVKTIDAAAGLRRLYLGHYAEADLTRLGTLGLLSRLVMKDRPQLRSLEGLSSLTELRHLGIFLAPKLADISALRHAVQLEELELEACRKISNIEAVEACVHLRMLNVSDDGDIATVAPLMHMDELELLYLFGSTKVVDGDLGPIARLPRLRELRMQSRRHYRPSVQQIQSTLPPED